MSTGLVKSTPTELATGASSVLDVIARAAADPSVNVDKLERLLAIQATIMADQRRTSYMAAMARLQASLPQITKAGTILDRDGKLRSTFAKIEDVDVAIRPLVAEQGFSFSLDSEPAGTAGTKFVLKMSHRDGHAESLSMLLPVSAPPGCSPAQGAGSTTSYARRYLLMMHLNLVMRDVDNDGQGESPCISAEQAEQLRRELAEVGGSEARFLAWLRVAAFEDVRADQMSIALMSLAEKRKGKGAPR